jgi:hypothetical protein
MVATVFLCIGVLIGLTASSIPTFADWILQKIREPEHSNAADTSDSRKKWEDFNHEMRQKAFEMGYVWDHENRKYKPIEATPGSYATGGDMDPEFKERMREAFRETNRLLKSSKPMSFKHGTETVNGKSIVNEQGREWFVIKDLPKGEPVKSHDEAREFIKKAYEHEENKGTYRFKIPEGVSVDFGKSPASTKLHVHLITDKGNVIVPGTSFLDHDAIKRVKMVHNISKWFDKINLLDDMRARKGRKFSPSSNPLGDTAAFMRTGNEPWMDGSHRSLYTPFRHRKGGRRG